MDFKSGIDLSQIPEEVPGQGHRRDMNMFSSLDEGRIAVPIPFRVQSGSAGSRGLILETYDDVYKFQWDQVEFLALGLIVNQLNHGKSPKSGMRMKIRELLLGDPEKKFKVKYQSELHILDIYLKDREAPFRIDQGSINYRGFLMRPGYVSIDNFRQLVAQVSYYSRQAHLNHQLREFLKNPRSRLDPFESLYDFQIACHQSRYNPRDLICRDAVEISLPRDAPPAEGDLVDEGPADEEIKNKTTDTGASDDTQQES